VGAYFRLVMLEMQSSSDGADACKRLRIRQTWDAERARGYAGKDKRFLHADLLCRWRSAPLNSQLCRQKERPVTGFAYFAAM
jgi:hypothetical protein